MKLAFVHAEKAFFPVSALCRLLGVSRQAYYASLKRAESPRLRQEHQLREQLRALHTQSRGTYGSPRLHAALRQAGHRVGKRRVERALRSMGLQGRQPRRWLLTTKPDRRHPVCANGLNRDFTATAPNTRWVTDISYIWTNEGWCYVAVILDLYSRAVVGWALDTSLTTRLPLDALAMAVKRRRPAAGLLHHSDRGCQYTSKEYRRELERLGVVASMSRRGNCWDNAVAESFFATLKNELVYTRSWRSRVEVRAALFDYIEVFYNRQRLHSAIGYRTPASIDSDYNRPLAA